MHMLQVFVSLSDICSALWIKCSCTKTAVQSALTLESFWDELNRQHDGPATANGVWTQMNLQWRMNNTKEKIKAEEKTKKKEDI